MEGLSYEDQIYLEHLSFMLCRVKFTPIVKDAEHGFITRNASDEEFDTFLEQSKLLYNDEVYVVGLCSSSWKVIPGSTD